MKRLLLVMAAVVPVLASGSAQADFQSSKMSSGIVVEGSALRLPKLSTGIVVEGMAFRAAKMSVGVVMENAAPPAFKSSKVSVGIVVLSIQGGGGVITRAPLTHW